MMEPTLTFDQLVTRLPWQMRKKLEDLKLLRERPDFHPEPNAFEHVKIVTERLITTGDPDLVCAGLFHDIHKLDCAKTNPKTGHPTSPGHDVMAERTCQTDTDVQEFIREMGASSYAVAWLCGQHMRVKQISQMREAKQKVFREHPLFPKLEVFTRADDMLKDFTP